MSTSTQSQLQAAWNELQNTELDSDRARAEWRQAERNRDAISWFHLIKRIAACRAESKARKAKRAAFGKFQDAFDAFNVMYAGLVAADLEGEPR